MKKAEELIEYLSNIVAGALFRPMIKGSSSKKKK